MTVMAITRSDLYKLSSQDLLSFGVHEVAYVKPISIKGKRAFAVHAADGTALHVAEDESSALMAIFLGDLDAVSLH